MKSVTEIEVRKIIPVISNFKRPIRVCQHVLRAAYNDVRSNRTASALAEAGFTTTLIDVDSEPPPSHEEAIDGIHLEHLVIRNWFTSRRFQPWFFLVAFRVFILSIIRLFQSQADIYHAHDLTALPACYIVAKLRRKPLIFETYELHLPAPDSGIVFWRLLGGPIMRLLAILLPRCQGVIAASPLYAQEFSRRYHLPEVVTIRNMLAYRAVEKNDRLRQYLGLGSQARIVLYQGHIQDDRGLELLVKAAPFLAMDTVIVMMGKDYGTTRAELEALITRDGVANRVKIIPPVPYEELLDWTASADIGLTIFPPDYSLSIRMTQPNKLFEYLMAGVPVLSTQLEAIVEVLETYDVGQVVTSIEPEAIGRAINAMLADEGALRRMSRNALEAAKNELNWEKESAQLVRVYKGIIEKKISRKNVYAKY